MLSVALVACESWVHVFPLSRDLQRYRFDPLTYITPPMYQTSSRVVGAQLLGDDTGVRPLARRDSQLILLERKQRRFGTAQIDPAAVIAASRPSSRRSRCRASRCTARSGPCPSRGRATPSSPHATTRDGVPGTAQTSLRSLPLNAGELVHVVPLLVLWSMKPEAPLPPPQSMTSPVSNTSTP